MMAKPIRALELHYSMIQFLILRVRLVNISEDALAKGNCSLSSLAFDKVSEFGIKTIETEKM